MQPILSICVVTMNRANQLREALESCLACELPKDTEFIVVDNASTDKTEMVVKELLGASQYHYYYEKETVNLGAGGGRFRYYELSRGKYVYGMDDDAVIDTEKNPNFFIRAIDILEKNDRIATLATQIYDKAWGSNRLQEEGRLISSNLYLCKMFCGGSHFLRRSAYENPPYFANIYGYEELPPSLIAFDKGYLNVFCSDLLVEHRPLVDKWNISNIDNHKFLINECATPYAIKRHMYPRIFMPILKLAFIRRCNKHLRHVPFGKKKAKDIVNNKEMYSSLNYKIKIRTVLKMYRLFGKSVF